MHAWIASFGARLHAPAQGLRAAPPPPGLAAWLAQLGGVLYLAGRTPGG